MLFMWTDVESTGLDERKGLLLEVALSVTDENLNELYATSTVVRPIMRDISQVKALMDSVVQEMHTQNGLIEEIKRGLGLFVRDAEACLIEWTRKVVAHYLKNQAMSAESREKISTTLTTDTLKVTPLAGSTVGFDRRWLRHHMPDLEALFSYRSVDVSSITELAKSWAPGVYESRPKGMKAHRALADVRESIEYLRYYRRTGFVGV